MNKGTETGQNTDRLSLLQEAFQAALDAGHGLQTKTEQEVSQLMNGLVKSKILLADDSFKLRDQLLDKTLADKALDARIENALVARGFITEGTMESVNKRLQSLES